MAKVSGVKGVLNRIRRLGGGGGAGAELNKQVAAALYRAGQEIETGAEQSITQGSISGKGHVPSLPGQPPNADTRHLDMNIETTIEAQNPPKVHVTSHAPYSAALEFGTSKMEERPFLRPQLKRTKPAEFVKDTINVISRKR